MGNLFRNSVVLFDLDKLNSEIASLDEEQNREGFWNDQKSALEVVNRLNDAKSKVQGYTAIKNDFDELSLLLDDPDSKTPDMRELIEGMEKEGLAVFARHYLKDHPETDAFLFGHYHVEVDEMLSPKTRFIILGEWISKYTYVVLDEGKLTMKNYTE